MRLKPRRRFGGSVRGERLTQSKGISIEFADYREYAEGDDLRHLDWNVLARLGNAVTKTYRDEEDLAVHILLDASASMSFGEPEKLQKAKQLAAGLALTALNGGDTVYLRPLSGNAPPPPALRGRGAMHRLFTWIDGLEQGTNKPVEDELRSFVQSSARLGVVVVISDALSKEAPAALRAIGARGHEVWLLQVLADTELDPDLEGDLRLLDSESARTAEVTINSYTLRDYKTSLAAHNRALAEECGRFGGRYVLVNSDSSLEETVNNIWRKEGWVE
ncbi:MAG: DUF58 domain-containing protein [Armatimonadetes bacterium]|nr:DUF58 domain-containing protein [Armatimonadota bacterium]